MKKTCHDADRTQKFQKFLSEARITALLAWYASGTASQDLLARADASPSQPLFDRYRAAQARLEAFRARGIADGLAYDAEVNELSRLRRAASRAQFELIGNIEWPYIVGSLPGEDGNGH